MVYSEPSDVPYSLNHFLGWDFFCRFLQVNLCQKLFFLQNTGRTCCVQTDWLNVRNNFVELGIFMYWTVNSMNNLLSYCGLVVERIRASEKDLPVHYTALADGLANYFKMGRTNSWRSILILMHLCFYTRIFNSFH